MKNYIFQAFLLKLWNNNKNYYFANKYFEIKLILNLNLTNYNWANY